MFRSIRAASFIAAAAFTAAASAQTTVLYDGSLGGGTSTPDDQGFLFVDLPYGTITPSASGGLTTLDTDDGIGNGTDLKAGFFTHDPVFGFPATGGLPALDAATGFTLRFHLAVLDELHESNHRAGFSVIAVSDSPSLAIELGFWEDSVWAYEFDGVSVFTRGEAASRAPAAMAAMTVYDLVVQGTGYSLFADGSPLLTGPLRDYTAYEGPLALPGFDVDPYDKANLIFLGDDTTSAFADVRLGDVSITIPEPAAAAMLIVPVLGAALGRRPRITIA